MTTSRLQIYNDALMMCGERALASLTENREPRFLLDQVWNNDGVLACLEEGQWYFAMRAIELDYDPGIEPPFGYMRAFEKPSDWVLTSAVCSDEFFKEPLIRYVDESGYWYSDLDTMYIRYVSDDANYGMNLAGWPRLFTDFVVAHFASKIVWKLTEKEAKLQAILVAREAFLRKAKNRSMMASSTSFPAQGNWTRSRLRGGGRNDGGSSGGNLIG